MAASLGYDAVSDPNLSRFFKRPTVQEHLRRAAAYDLASRTPAPWMNVLQYMSGDVFSPWTETLRGPRSVEYGAWCSSGHSAAGVGGASAAAASAIAASAHGRVSPRPPAGSRPSSAGSSRPTRPTSAGSSRPTRPTSATSSRGGTSAIATGVTAASAPGVRSTSAMAGAAGQQRRPRNESQAVEGEDEDARRRRQLTEALLSRRRLVLGLGVVVDPMEYILATLPAPADMATAAAAEEAVRIATVEAATAPHIARNYTTLKAPQQKPEERQFVPAAAVAGDHEGGGGSDQRRPTSSSSAAAGAASNHHHTPEKQLEAHGATSTLPRHIFEQKLADLRRKQAMYYEGRAVVSSGYGAVATRQRAWVPPKVDPRRRSLPFANAPPLPPEHVRTAAARAAQAVAEAATCGRAGTPPPPPPPTTTTARRDRNGELHEHRRAESTLPPPHSESDIRLVVDVQTPSPPTTLSQMPSAPQPPPPPPAAPPSSSRRAPNRRAAAGASPANGRSAHRDVFAWGDLCGDGDAFVAAVTGMRFAAAPPGVTRPSATRSSAAAVAVFTDESEAPAQRSRAPLRATARNGDTTDDGGFTSINAAQTDGNDATRVAAPFVNGEAPHAAAGRHVSFSVEAQPAGAQTTADAAANGNALRPRPPSATRSGRRRGSTTADAATMPSSVAASSHANGAHVAKGPARQSATHSWSGRQRRAAATVEAFWVGFTTRRTLYVGRVAARAIQRWFRRWSFRRRVASCVKRMQRAARGAQARRRVRWMYLAAALFVTESRAREAVEAESCVATPLLLHDAVQSEWMARAALLAEWEAEVESTGRELLEEATEPSARTALCCERDAAHELLFAEYERAAAFANALVALRALEATTRSAAESAESNAFFEWTCLERTARCSEVEEPTGRRAVLAQAAVPFVADWLVGVETLARHGVASAACVALAQLCRAFIVGWEAVARFRGPTAELPRVALARDAMNARALTVALRNEDLKGLLAVFPEDIATTYAACVLVVRNRASVMADERMLQLVRLVASEKRGRANAVEAAWLEGWKELQIAHSFAASQGATSPSFAADTSVFVIPSPRGVSPIPRHFDDRCSSSGSVAAERP